MALKRPPSDPPARYTHHYDLGVLAPSERRSRWRRLTPWYDALLLAGLTVAIFTWVLDRTADLDLSAWMTLTSLVTLTVALRPVTRWLAT